MPDAQLSNAQIDQLGEKLRSQSFGEAELRLLDEYRRMFGRSYDRVVATVQDIVDGPVSGRPAKSTTSIVEKLNRESIRLSQMQDIAGCRVVVADLAAQDRVVNTIAQSFEHVTIFDRRPRPSHGYRAVHVIVRENGKPVEVQIRTSLQHLWAEVSEKCADAVGGSVKYGGGPTALREILDMAAAQVKTIEELDLRLAGAGEADRDTADQLRETRERFFKLMQRIIDNVDSLAKGLT